MYRCSYQWTTRETPQTISVGEGTKEGSEEESLKKKGSKWESMGMEIN